MTHFWWCYLTAQSSVSVHQLDTLYDECYLTDIPQAKHSLFPSTFILSGAPLTSFEQPAALAVALGILLHALSPCSPSLPHNRVSPRTLTASLLWRLHSYGLNKCLIVSLLGCHCRTFSHRATAIYTYPADLHHLARMPGLLHSSPTFQEPSPADILASSPLLYGVYRRIDSLWTSFDDWHLNWPLVHCYRCCWAVVAAQHPFRLTGQRRVIRPHDRGLLSMLARDVCALVATTSLHAITIINACPWCLHPRGNGHLACYYYYQRLPSMTVPLWQRLPRVPLLSSTLARDYCTLVAQTVLCAKSQLQW